MDIAYDLITRRNPDFIKKHADQPKRTRFSSKTQLRFLIINGRDRKTKPTTPVSTISRIRNPLPLLPPLVLKLNLVQDTRIEEGVSLLEWVVGQDVQVRQTTSDVEEHVEVVLVERPDL